MLQQAYGPGVTDMDENQIRQAIERYEFYHIIQLTETIATPGWKEFVPSQQPVHQAIKSIDMAGKRFLDIGCRDGMFSYQAERQGAEEVVGVDNDLSIAATEFLIPFLKSKVKMQQLSVLDLSPDELGTFDVALFAGVLYHLRYPFWSLKKIADMMNEGGVLILETAVSVDDCTRSLLDCPIGNESPYEPTSCTFFNMKGLVDTLFSLGLVTERASLLNVGGQVQVAKQEQQTITIELTDEQVQRPAAPIITLESPPQSPLVDRTTLVCRKDSSVIDRQVDQYWNGTHNIHDVNKMYDAA